MSRINSKIKSVKVTKVMIIFPFVT